MATKEIHSTDYLDTYEEALDFVTIQAGARPIEAITEREFKDRIEFEKFMQDVLVIKVHSTGDPNEPPSAFVGSNGRKGWIPRDVPIKIRREFVGSLAQGQLTIWRTEKVADPEAPEGTRARKKTAAAYPFDVLVDPHPRGRAWLERMMRQG